MLFVKRDDATATLWGTNHRRMLTRSLRFGTLLANQRTTRARVSEPPLRAELFGVEQLARHAEALAANHQIATARGANRLLARLDHNEEILRAFLGGSFLGGRHARRVSQIAEVERKVLGAEAIRA